MSPSCVAVLRPPGDVEQGPLSDLRPYEAARHPDLEVGGIVAAEVRLEQSGVALLEEFRSRFLRRRSDHREDAGRRQHRGQRLGHLERDLLWLQLHGKSISRPRRENLPEGEK